MTEPATEENADSGAERSREPNVFPKGVRLGLASRLSFRHNNNNS